MSDDHKPRRAFGGDGPREGESVPDWFRRTFGEMPPPTPEMDKADEHPDRERRHEAMMATERSIPPVYAWARFSAPELAERVPEPSAVAAGRALCRRTTRLCLIGAARAGKTSLAVAMLRRRVSQSGIPAAFLPAYKLGVARLQHAAGHGEPEIVDRAMTMPLVLLDDLGCERDLAMSPIPDIIFERHAANRPTWVTTGLTSQQLIKRYGTGVVGRVFDRAKIIQLGDRDFVGDYGRGR